MIEATRPVRPLRRLSRRGATAVELALTLLLFLTLVLGMLDLGIAVFRYHLLAEAARQGARCAIVHGSLADRLTPWGPESYAGTAADGHPIAVAVQSTLVGMDPSETTIEAQWIDGSNEFDRRVSVTVTAPYQPLMTFIFGNPTITLQGSSTMPIAH